MLLKKEAHHVAAYVYLLASDYEKMLSAADKEISLLPEDYSGYYYKGLAAVFSSLIG